MNGGGDVVGLAARGDGVTRDGRFVAGAVPGDVVGDHGALIAGPHRAAPPCRHFPECGGCQLQHVDDAAYRAFVVDRIVRPLAAVGITPKDIAPVALSPPRSRRRASLKAQRVDGAIAIGFYREGSRVLVPIVECHVLLPELFALLRPLKPLLASLLRAGQTAGVTLTRCDHGVDLLLANVDAGARSLATLGAFAAEHRLARLSVEGAGGVETIVDAGARVSLGGVPVALPPGAFLQATREGEAALVAAVLAGVGAAGRVADLFAGAGTFALPLAAAGARVLAADAAGPAIEALGAAARQAAFRVATEHRDLFRRPLSAAELNRHDALVIDPPRAGSTAQTAEVAASRVARVMMVSCNPSTFARDAATLAAPGFRLERLWPVAQFRWSTHVELAAEFVR